MDRKYSIRGRPVTKKAWTTEVTRLRNIQKATKETPPKSTTSTQTKKSTGSKTTGSSGYKVTDIVITTDPNTNEKIEIPVAKTEEGYIYQSPTGEIVRTSKLTGIARATQKSILGEIPKYATSIATVKAENYSKYKLANVYVNIKSGKEKAWLTPSGELTTSSISGVSSIPEKELKKRGWKQVSAEKISYKDNNIIGNIETTTSQLKPSTTKQVVQQINKSISRDKEDRIVYPVVSQKFKDVSLVSPTLARLIVSTPELKAKSKRLEQAHKNKETSFKMHTRQTTSDPQEIELSMAEAEYRKAKTKSTELSQQLQKKKQEELGIDSIPIKESASKSKYEGTKLIYNKDWFNDPSKALIKSTSIHSDTFFKFGEGIGIATAGVTKGLVRGAFSFPETIIQSPKFVLKSVTDPVGTGKDIISQAVKDPAGFSGELISTRLGFKALGGIGKVKYVKPPTKKIGKHQYKPISEPHGTIVIVGTKSKLIHTQTLKHTGTGKLKVIKHEVTAKPISGKKGYSQFEVKKVYENKPVDKIIASGIHKEFAKGSHQHNIIKNINKNIVVESKKPFLKVKTTKGGAITLHKPHISKPSKVTLTKTHSSILTHLGTKNKPHTIFKMSAHELKYKYPTRQPIIDLKTGKPIKPARLEAIIKKHSPKYRPLPKPKIHTLTGSVVKIKGNKIQPHITSKHISHGTLAHGYSKIPKLPPPPSIKLAQHTRPHITHTKPLPVPQTKPLSKAINLEPKAQTKPVMSKMGVYPNPSRSPRIINTIKNQRIPQLNTLKPVVLLKKKQSVYSKMLPHMTAILGLQNTNYKQSQQPTSLKINKLISTKDLKSYYKQTQFMKPEQILKKFEEVKPIQNKKNEQSLKIGNLSIPDIQPPQITKPSSKPQSTPPPPVPQPIFRNIPIIPINKNLNQRIFKGKDPSTLHKIDWFNRRFKKMIEVI